MGRPRKTTWEPCAGCGNRDGKGRRPGDPPLRCRLPGLPGRYCATCFDRMRIRIKRGQPPQPEVPDRRALRTRELLARIVASYRASSDVGITARECNCGARTVKKYLRSAGIARVPKPPVPVLPCARCHDPGGVASTGCKRPARYDGAPYGFAGGICSACRQALRLRLKRGIPLDAPRLRVGGMRRKSGWIPVSETGDPLDAYSGRSGSSRTAPSAASPPARPIPRGKAR